MLTKSEVKLYEQTFEAVVFLLGLGRVTHPTFDRLLMIAAGWS